MNGNVGFASKTACRRRFDIVHSPLRDYLSLMVWGFATDAWSAGADYPNVYLPCQPYIASIF
jgi:hypothetical protein